MTCTSRIKIVDLVNASATLMLAGALSLTVPTWLNAAESDTPGTNTFTEDQFERGGLAYRESCASCHGTDLDNGAAPSLKGATFRKTWSRLQASVADLHERIQTTMPPGAAGALSERQYLEVLAFVLGSNNVLVGTEPLQASFDYLNAIPFSRGDEELDIAANYIVGENGLVPQGDGPDFETLLTAADDHSNWLYHNNNYQGTRYSALDEINLANVSALQQRCSYQLNSQSSMQTGPIVYEGIMYVTNETHTAAINASNCEPLWQHEWEPRDRQVWGNNRGVAIKDGYVVRGTSDGYLFALDSANGNLLWARQVADPWLGENFTMPPMIFEDLILIGPAGSEHAISGWVGAFRIADGIPVWKFLTVPEAAAGGGETWGNPMGIPLGGGAVWTPFSMSAENDELYVAVTNPAPDLPAFLRPGDNLYTNSLVALNPRSGELLWHRQMVPNDDHDWDLTQVSPVLQAGRDGVDSGRVATVGKDGVLRLVDLGSHNVLFETPVTTLENHDVPVTPEGVHACPGVTAGVLWSGPAYHPDEQLIFTPSTDYCATFAAAETVNYIPGQLFMGGSVVPDDEYSGWLSAIDANTGELRWRFSSDFPMLGAVTTTAGGLVIAGELTGALHLFDASNGEIAHSLDVGAPIGGGIVTYEVEGKQYIAVSSGRAAIAFPTPASRDASVSIYTLP